MNADEESMHCRLVAKFVLFMDILSIYLSISQWYRYQYRWNTNAHYD